MKKWVVLILASLMLAACGGKQEAVEQGAADE